MQHKRLLTGIIAATMLAACTADTPQREDIMAAIERTQFMNFKIGADNISDLRCEERGKLHHCKITYLLPRKKAAGTISLDKQGHLNLEIERVGKNWRISRIADL